MIVCPVCAFRNPDANDRCFRCSALLKRNADEVDAAFEKADKKTRLHTKRQLWAGPAERIREHPLVLRLNAIPDDDRYRYPFTAGLFSIIWPGAGHIYVGQQLKGALYMFAAAMMAIIAWITIRECWSNYYLFAVLMFWLYVWSASVATALRANGATLARRHMAALLFAAMFLVGSFLAAAQFFSVGFFSLQKVTSAATMPFLAPGERVLFTNVPLWFRAPRRDEIVMFDPPRFAVQTSNGDALSVNITRYYQRVLGVGGDTVKKADHQFWRNGQPLAPGQLPFGSDMMPDFELVVPPGRFYVPITYIPEPDMLASLVGAPTLAGMYDPGTVVIGWDGFPFVSDEAIEAKGVAVTDPPAMREWLP